MRIHGRVQLLLLSKHIAAAEREQWLETAAYTIFKAFQGIPGRETPRNWWRCGEHMSHIAFTEGFGEYYGLHNATLPDASTWAAVFVNECGLHQRAANRHR